MGGCLSSGAGGSDLVARDQNQKPTANVISVNGDLHQYTVPITVSQVLQSESEKSTSSSPSFFVCSSDRLYYDDYIPALDLSDELEGNQIYFVLPTVKLHYRLSASDMAAMAVKASVALNNGSRSRDDTKSSSFFGRRSTKKGRISPVVLIMESGQRLLEDEGLKKKSFSGKSAGRVEVSRSGSGSGSSVKKLKRHSSRRNRLAVRSFRLRLSTIYEGSVL